MAPTAVLSNVVTTKRFLINAGEEFIIGRSITCSVKINEPYINRHHCFIEYENDRFIIFGSSTCIGIFLNGNELPPGKTNSAVLKSGDIISFGCYKNYDYMFVFRLLKKKPKVDKKCNELEEKQSKLAIQRLELIKEIESSIFEFRKVLGTIIKLKKTYLRDVDFQKKLNEQDPFREFNDKMLELLAIYFQCSICNDDIIKAKTTICKHNFCEHCIDKWLRVRNSCPLCCSQSIKTIRNFSIDMFLKKVYKLIGGTEEMKRRIKLTKRNTEVRNMKSSHKRSSRFVTPYVLNSQPIDVDEPITLSDDEGAR